MPRLKQPAGTERSPRSGGRTLGAVSEWWWNLDHRRHIAQLGDEDRRHPLDEGYVVWAMARQLEEIRNLPQIAS